MHKTKRTAVLIASYTAVCAAITGSALLTRFSEQAYLDALKVTGAAAPKEVVTTAPDTVTVVVASRALPYGTTLTRAHLKEVEQLKDAVPVGTFRSIDALFAKAAQGDRQLLAGLGRNEPVQMHRVSAPGHFATLAARLGHDTRAVSVHVDPVLGVAGFVRPGDFVDVLMTRNPRTEDDERNDFAVVLLQKVHVLGIDQTSHVTSDASSGVKRTPKTITLEVSVDGAQKLALARTVGRLSLALRRPTLAASDDGLDDVKRISIVDIDRGASEETRGEMILASSITAPPAPPVAVAPVATAKVVKKPSRFKTIGVTRALQRSEHAVVKEFSTGAE